MNGIWALKPYYLGPWTLRVSQEGTSVVSGLVTCGSSEKGEVNLSRQFLVLAREAPLFYLLLLNIVAS